MASKLPSRVQAYVDMQAAAAGGGIKPDGTHTPVTDMDSIVKALQSSRGNNQSNLVLDPHPQSRHTIQTALRDAFGWDGKKDPEPYQLQRLRDLAATMDYQSPIRVLKLVVVDTHDDCRMPHPGDD